MKYIRHINGHFTKFSALSALPSEEAIEVANVRLIYMLLGAALPEIFWSMNATWHSAIKTTPYDLVFGGKFNLRNHLDHHQRIEYTSEGEAILLEEIDERRQYTL